MYDFGNWPDRIAAVSNRPEFNRATIEIIDPTQVTSSYDIDTGEWAITGDGRITFADGTQQTSSRVIGIRSERDVSGASTGNPDAAKAMRVAFPYEVYPDRIYKDWQVRVIDSPRNPGLTSYVYVVRADEMNSNRAGHVLECVLSVESELVVDTP